MTIETLDEDQPTSRPILGQVLFYQAICLIVGGLTASFVLARENGLDTTIVLLGGGFFLVGSIMLAVALRVGNFEPLSLSTKAGRAQIVLLGSLLFGALLGIYFATDDRLIRWYDGSLVMSPLEGVIGLVLLFGLMLPINIYWGRTIDEHENAAAQSAGYFALYTYFFAYLGWAIGAFARFVPPVNDAALFCITIFVFGAVWVTKRAG